MKKIILIFVLFLSFNVYAEEKEVSFTNKSNVIKNSFLIKVSNEETNKLESDIINNLTNKSKIIINNLFNENNKQSERIKNINKITNDNKKAEIKEIITTLISKKIDNDFKGYKISKIKNIYLVIVENNTNSINLFFNSNFELINIDTTYINNTSDNISNILGITKSSKLENNALINNIKNNIVTLKTFSDKNVIDQSIGFYVQDGILVTSWKFISNSIRNGSVIVLTNNNKSEIVEKIINIDSDLDLAFIKVEKTGSYISLGSYTNSVKLITIENNDYYGYSGILLEGNTYNYSNIKAESNQAGSPLINNNGEAVGILTKNTDNNISAFTSSSYIKKYVEEYIKIGYENIKSININTLREKYYSKKTTEVKNIKLTEAEFNNIKKIGNLESNIDFDLVKSVKYNNIFLLRYKNKYSNMISSISKMSKFRTALKEEGYKEILSSNTKFIYKNNDFKITATEAFNYLIIIFEEVK